MTEKDKREAFMSRQVELGDFMEDHGFDSIGSSDLIADFGLWAVTEDHGEPVEELFDRFRSSEVWSQYFG